MTGTGAWLVAAVVAFNLACMPGQFLDGDPAAWREEARSLLVSGEWRVSERFAARFGQSGQYFVRNEADGGYYSKYGVMNALMSLPPLLAQKLIGPDLATPGKYPPLLAANLWNVALCALLASLLFRLSGDYTRRTSLRLLFVVGTLYGSALWYYQRAQSSEIYQAVFFTALFIFLTSFLRALRSRGPAVLRAADWWRLGAVWLLAAMLVLTRLVYGLLLPLVVLLALYAAFSGRSWAELRPSVFRLCAVLVVPGLAILALLGWINSVKFGSPWITGYHEWRPQAHMPTGRLSDGLWGFLFSPRFSIFLHYPLLLFALPGFPEFVRRHRMEAIALLAIFGTFLLVISTFPTWAGEASYGPRYLLFVLPALSLPFVVFADSVLDRLRSWRARALVVATLGVLAWSAYLQVQVNRLGFLFYYQASSVMTLGYMASAADYFRDHHVGVISDDLIRHRGNLDALPFFADLKRIAPPEKVEHYRREIGMLIDKGNWYWSTTIELRR